MQKIPGIAIAIVKNGNILYNKGYEVANQNQDPVIPETNFSIGSLTKSFTSLAIMQLVESKK